MNILQIKYAVEVARLGSINRAAEELYIAQPNLSRYIRELEGELGISIFKRTHRGMVPTPEGETFIRYAEQILDTQVIDRMEDSFDTAVRGRIVFGAKVIKPGELVCAPVIDGGNSI